MYSWKGHEYASESSLDYNLLFFDETVQVKPTV